MSSEWVTFYEPESGQAYRIAARSMTVRDGIRLGELEDAIAQRADLGGRLLIALAHYYPLLVCGTRACERVALDAAPEITADGEPILPDDLPWQDFDLTESVFLDLPDYLMWAWYSAVLRLNPHYDRSYDVLKKNLSRMMRRPTSNDATPPSASAESSTATASLSG